MGVRDKVPIKRHVRKFIHPLGNNRFDCLSPPRIVEWKFQDFEEKHEIILMLLVPPTLVFYLYADLFRKNKQ